MNSLTLLQATRILACACAFGFASAIFHPPQSSGQAPPPVTSVDAQEYKAAEDTFNKGDFKAATEQFEKFLEKYKMLSPRSLDAKFRLAFCYLKQDLFDDAMRLLRDLIANPKVEVPAKEMAQSLVGKSLTLKGFKMPSGTEQQKLDQKKVFADAIKEYDAFVTAYPRSQDMDGVLFLRATLLLQTDNFQEAHKGFLTVAGYPKSPYKWDAYMWSGKTSFIQANTLLEIKAGAEPKPEDIQKALALFDAAQPVFGQVYGTSGDVALQNDAVFFVGQMQLTRSQHATDPDGAKAEQKKNALLNAALEAFRAVRSVEEVVGSQDAKIKALEQEIQLLVPGVEFLAKKNRFENLINHENEKKDKLKDGQDQYLAARLAIARIFLYLKKPDESRALIRYLLGQPDLFAKDKDAQANVTALLCLTYVEQKNADKAMESYQEFRKNFKGNIVGDNLPLTVASVLVDRDRTDEAEKVVAEGEEDYKPWRFTSDSLQIMVASALKKQDFAKALELCDKILAGAIKPELEAQFTYLKGNVQQGQALEASDPDLAAKAIGTFAIVRDKFPASPYAEDAWYNTGQILVGIDPAKAVDELDRFIAKYGDGSGKSDTAKTNLPNAQYQLGTALEKTNQSEKAAAEWQKVIDKYPDSEAAPGAFFKIFDLHKDKNPRQALKLMDDFIQKYPKHENVYYAYNNLAEFLFAGTLDSKTDEPKPITDSLEAGTRKLYEYVDYEITNDLKVKRGDSSLMKVADRWVRELVKLPSYLSLNPEQRIVWQKSVDSTIAAVERLLKDYTGSERVAEGLERLVTVQSARRKSQQADAAQVEKYFRDLGGNYSSNALVKAKIDAALAAFLNDQDAKRAFTVIEEAFRVVPELVKIAGPDGGPERIVATFAPADYDRYLEGLFGAKRFDEMTKIIGRIRQEYPLGENEPPSNATPTVRDGQAVALFWEAKLLAEQGKLSDAGTKFSQLKDRFPKSSKALEADYGVILGEFEETGKVKDDYFARLQKIIKNPTGKGFELQAKCLFLAARLYEARKEFDQAVETYKRIQFHYSAVPKIAAEGLWKAAQIAEKQARADPAYPVKTQKEKKEAAAAKAAQAKAAAAEEAANLKKTDPTDTKPSTETPEAGKPEAGKPEAGKPDATPPAAAPEKPATESVPAKK